MRDSGFTGLIGVVREDVTPPVRIYCGNWGTAKHDVAEGVHRPLTLKALILHRTGKCGRRRMNPAGRKR